jgi:hypothetical protein
MSVIRSSFIVVFLLYVYSLSNTVHARELSSEDIKTLFSGKTSECIKSKDFSICDTYMGNDGKLKRFTHKDGKLKLGTWRVNADKLCIKWQGKKSDICFLVIENSNGTHRLVRRNKTKAVVSGFIAGDSITADTHK